jgi:hypothetical protein
MMSYARGLREHHRFASVSGFGPERQIHYKVRFFMQQPCSRCGYLSDRPARFCRQCGAALFTETDATSATTRNYPHQADVAPAGAEASVPETSRFYRPPVAPDHPMYANYPVAGQPVARKKSSAGWWILIALLSLLLLGSGLIVMVSNALKGRLSPPVASRPVEAPDALPGGPPPPLPPPAPGEAGNASELPMELRRYAYDGAEVKNTVNVMGNQLVTMTTGDDIKTIREHYQKLLGPPMVETSDKAGKTLLFQTSDSPMVLITIQPDEDDSGKNQITLTRSPFVPKMK